MTHRRERSKAATRTAWTDSKGRQRGSSSRRGEVGIPQLRNETLPFLLILIPAPDTRSIAAKERGPGGVAPRTVPALLPMREPLSVSLARTQRGELEIEYEIEVFNCAGLSFNSQSGQEFVNLCETVKGLRRLSLTIRRKEAIVREKCFSLYTSLKS